MTPFYITPFDFNRIFFNLFGSIFDALAINSNLKNKIFFYLLVKNTKNPQTHFWPICAIFRWGRGARVQKHSFVWIFKITAGKIKICDWFVLTILKGTNFHIWLYSLCFQGFSKMDNTSMIWISSIASQRNFVHENRSELYKKLYKFYFCAWARVINNQ